ncbi:MAG: hypothetical protein AAF518_20860 [Spirochaetota bacterium]
MKKKYIYILGKLFFLSTLCFACNPTNRVPLKHTLPYSFSFEEPLDVQIQGKIHYHILSGKEEALFSISNRHEENLILPTCKKLFVKTLSKNSIKILQNVQQKKKLESKWKDQLQSKLQNYFLSIDGFAIHSVKAL